MYFLLICVKCPCNVTDETVSLNLSSVDNNNNNKYSEHGAEYLETEVAEDMRAVDDAVRVCRPLSTNNTLFICIIRTHITGSNLSLRLPQQISHQEVLHFSEIYQWQQEKQKLLQ